MSNQNNEANGAVVGLVLIGVMMWIMFLIVFAIAAFASVVFTIVAFCAWNRPVTLFGETMQPHEARAFIARGLAGAALLPVIVVFASAMFKVAIINEAWPYFFVGGYTLGSLGIEILLAKAKEANAARGIYVAPPPALPPAPKQQAPQQPREPFTFASWDDEEDKR